MSQQARRRTGAHVGLGPIGAPTDFTHILANPVNPFATTAADSQGGMYYNPPQAQYPHSQPQHDPFADDYATGSGPVRQVYGQGVRRKGVTGQDISGPVSFSCSSLDKNRS